VKYIPLRVFCERNTSAAAPIEVISFVIVAALLIAAFGVSIYRTERELREIDRAAIRERVWYG